LLDNTILLLDNLALTLGDLRISALTVIKGLASLAILLWLATLLSGAMERRISTLPNLTPSVRVLFSKLLKTVLITLAIVVALSTVGIDLTAFAVFSGAVGVGIGFGLQKVVSNLISGVILLMDKSVKPGDVISVGDTYGSVNSLGARYASVVTRDGMEYLIPNEDIITQQVVNWSYSSNAVRLGIPVGVSYKADVRQAIALCKEAAAEVPRVIAEPKTVCLLKGFGDSSVDLELRFWIEDPQNGISNVKSEILLLIWDKFHQHDIEIPFPQRDLHIKPSEVPPAASGA
jgi:small-conductance mechanosensitive channel